MALSKTVGDPTTCCVIALAALLFGLGGWIYVSIISAAASNPAEHWNKPRAPPSPPFAPPPPPPPPHNPDPYTRRRRLQERVSPRGDALDQAKRARLSGAAGRVLEQQRRAVLLREAGGAAATTVF